MNRNVPWILMVMAIVIGGVAFQSCSGEQNLNGSGGNGEMSWVNEDGTPFNGMFGWNTNDLDVAAYTALSVANCTDLENFLTITNGASEDPCQEALSEIDFTDADLTGHFTIHGYVCETDAASPRAYEIECNNGQHVATSLEPVPTPTPGPDATPTPAPTATPTPTPPPPPDPCIINPLLCAPPPPDPCLINPLSCPA